MKDITLLCVGGDARQIYMCEKLAENAKVYAMMTGASPRGALTVGGPEDMKEKADVLVLPMLLNVRHSGGRHFLPCGLRQLDLESLLDCLAEDAFAVGGKPDEQTKELFASRGITLEDYFERRELVINNCIPTAEGALMIAMQEQAATVFGSRVLVIGYGNVGKAAARLFAAAGAETFCSVRRCDAAAEASANRLGVVMLGQLAEAVSGFDIIINTVPAQVLTEQILKNLSPKALIIDLASAPGGVDKEACGKLGIRLIHALALPGKVAPVTAGRYIAEAVENIISERRKRNVT